MNKIAIYLNRHITGSVFDKDPILEAYSTDASLLKIKPRFVAIPESTSDIRKLVKFIDQLSEKNYQLSIAIRGSGLSKTGADLSSGLVISMEKLNHVRELDAHDRLIHVQAGITVGKLNAVLAPYGLTLPVHADPKETIGSLISNCPKDDFSGKYGGIMNFVERIEVILSNGDILQTSRMSKGKLRQTINKKENRISSIYGKLSKILVDNQELISEQTTSLGYPALKHVKRLNGKVFDILPAFYGAEGSLGIITEVILRVAVQSPRKHRVFAVFNSFENAKSFLDYCQTLRPLSLQLYDNRIFKLAEEYGKKPDLLTKKYDEGYMVLASFNDKMRKSRRKVRKCVKFLPKSAYVVPETIKNSSDFDDFETSLSIYINSGARTERPNLLNDFFVPKEKLQDFLEETKKYEKKIKKPLAIYGNYATDNYSFRPEFDLKKIEERRTALIILRDIAAILKSHEGNIAGGYPEGRLKPVVVYPELDKKEKELIEKVKKIFDPNNILTPESKSNYNTKSAVRHLRTDISTSILS